MNGQAVKSRSGTTIDQHQSVNVGSPDRSGRGDLRAKGDSENAHLAAVTGLALKIGGHALNGGSPVRQPLGIVGDARPRIARRGYSVEVVRR
jgi:hypothetical protein